MTAEEHIVCWIESNQPHYRKLLNIAEPDNFIRYTGRAYACINLAVSAYQEMVRGGDAWAGEHDASTILGAALALSKWELEQ